jgi:anti-sigma B factor antagonist
VITETRTHTIEPDVTVFEISGRLNLGNLLMTVENAVRGLIDGGVRKLAIDLTGLNAIDSAGIGMLVGCNGYMEDKGGKMRLVGAQGAVAKVFAMVHMDRIVPVDADVAEASGHLSAGGAAG